MSGATSSSKDSRAYAGEVSAKEAWQRLSDEPAALLVDVRSIAEWNFVGIPELSSLSRTAVLVEWQTFPPGPAPNPEFASELGQALAKAGYQKGNPLFFICRSGSRSRSAAIAATAAGFGPCFNIYDGCRATPRTGRRLESWGPSLGSIMRFELRMGM
jgi:rhodanese-related sulfurtransferase